MKNGRQHGFVPSASSGSPAGGVPAHPLDWPTNAGAVGDVLNELNARLKDRRRRRFRKIAGAVAALVIVGAGWHSIFQTSTPADLITSPAPLVSFPRQQTLPDGSVVEFRHDAAIAVRFTDSLRQVVLERGEAHFAVTKDETRPFVVRAGAIGFRAVGTAFAVHLADSKVEMIVTEGRVAVSSEDGGRNAERGRRKAEDGGQRTEDGGQKAEGRIKTETPSSGLRRPPSVVPPSSSDILAIVEAGNHVVVDVAAPRISTPTVSALTPSQMSQRFAWRVPKLEFSGTPLAKAIEMINEHSAMYRRPLLILGDPSLVSVRISGILRADNVDTLIGVLEADHGIKAEKRGEAEIVLHAR